MTRSAALSLSESLSLACLSVMKTEGLSHWWSVQVRCVSIPPHSLVPDRRHVVADLTNRLGGAGPHPGGRAAMHTLENARLCSG